MKKKESKSKTKLESAAILTIKDADIMTKKGRKNVAEWLRSCANDLEELGDNYNGTFRARYLYNRRVKDASR